MNSDSQSATAPHPSIQTAWRQAVAKFQTPSTLRAIWQLTNTLIPYALLWFAMYFVSDYSWWLTVACAALAGGFLIRIFIILHDCGHGSYFRSRRTNDIIGSIAGVLTVTPYLHWRWQHAVHHSTAGHLDKRGTGDIWTMTVREYAESSRWNKFAYRFARSPWVMVLVAPLFMLLIMQRFVAKGAKRSERLSVWGTNIGMIAVAVALSSIFGFGTYALIQLIIVAVGGACGIWLFYVQHQFEHAYWERGGDWNYTAAALKGSSFYKLPAVLQWFSGNIGFHHIHHLSARIPNYHLQRCHEADPLFKQVVPITLLASLRTATLKLWDEKTKRMVSFGSLR